MGHELEAQQFARVWSRLTVPIRPSAEGLAVYRRALEPLEERRILVLGATPELVDLALELGAETLVSIERFGAVLEAMRRVATRDWSSVRLLEGDWLEDRPELHGAFTAVVCDGGLLFLEYPAQWRQLFAQVRRYLEPGGVFVAKEWAEPPGDRDHDALVEDLIGAFEDEEPERAGADARAAYVRLVSELRVAGLVAATGEDGAFDQRTLVERCDALLARLERAYPDPERVEIARAAFLHLARSRPGATDTVAGVRFEDAAPLLEACGFTCENAPLPDPPIPGGNYMFVARTPGPRAERPRA